MATDLAAWLAEATADAEARALSALVPLLQALARSLQSLRDADVELGHPAAAHFTAADDADDAR